MTESRKAHRPTLRESAVLETMGDGVDPIADVHVAHETADALLRRGRGTHDPAETERLIALTDEVGLPTLADLWSSRPGDSLPGALWRLYLLREWMRMRPEEVAEAYAAGVSVTGRDQQAPGDDGPDTPEDVIRVADEILRGAYAQDFAVALERAAAFCRVVAAGRELTGPDSDGDADGPDSGATAAEGLRAMAGDLVHCARLWRDGSLR